MSVNQQRFTSYLLSFDVCAFIVNSMKFLENIFCKTMTETRVNMSI